MKVSPNILTGKPASACGFYTITRLFADARARVQQLEINTVAGKILE